MAQQLAARIRCKGFYDPVALDKWFARVYNSGTKWL